MTNYTDSEKAVYNAMLDICADGYSADAREIAEYVETLSVPQIKGVMSSLAKKGMIQTESEKRGGQVFHDSWPLVGESKELFSYGGESLSLQFNDCSDFYI